jgi:hypothetical protein
MPRSYLKPETKIGFLILKKQLFLTKGITPYQRVYWECKCICGKTVVRREDFLKSGRAINGSCGCKHPRHFKNEKHPLWCGYGDISGQYISEIKCRAKRNNQEFKVTIEQLWEIFLKQEKKCALSGKLLTFAGLRARRKNRELQTASLDRIDSSKGYTIDNVQWIHKDINKMKQEFNQEYFIKLCQEISNYNSGKISSNVPRTTA